MIYPKNPAIMYAVIDNLTPVPAPPGQKAGPVPAGGEIYRSDDRGDSWQVISEDLTTKTDRNSWPVMGKFWSADAVAKDVSTSLWGTIVSLAESPLNENLLYAGTDDGVVSVTEDGGKNWNQVKNFPGIPEYTYVSHLHADRFGLTWQLILTDPNPGTTRAFYRIQRDTGL